MAPPEPSPESTNSGDSLLHTYLGITFSVTLALLPLSTSRARSLAIQLFHAEEQIRQMRSRRQEDCKANARVVEIFAGHRIAWREEERSLVARLEAAEEEARGLREEVGRLREDVREREGVIEGLRRRVEEEVEEEEEEFVEKGVEVEEKGLGFNGEYGLGREGWMQMQDSRSYWQDSHYEALEPPYPTHNYVPKRESPWNVDGESTGVSSKLQSLDQELVNLDAFGNGELLKVPSLMRKQAKRYHSLAAKIYDLCKRMQISDPVEPTLGLEFRTQRQTEFLLEAFRLQHRATETRQKLTALQVEAASSCIGDELKGQSKVNAKKSMEFIRTILIEIQRNLEVLLARIMGDLEGILARDGASHVGSYHVSRYPFAR